MVSLSLTHTHTHTKKFRQTHTIWALGDLEAHVIWVMFLFQGFTHLTVSDYTHITLITWRSRYGCVQNRSWDKVSRLEINFLFFSLSSDTRWATMWFTLTCEITHILLCDLGAKPTDTFYFSLYKKSSRGFACLLLNPYMFLNRGSRHADGRSEPDSNLYHFLLNPWPSKDVINKWIVHHCLCPPPPTCSLPLIPS